MKYRLNLPLSCEESAKLRQGDRVYLSGVIYTGRDAAHRRMDKLLDEKKQLPFELKDSVIYYVGPSPEQPGRIIGSAGPTTSYRMDAYAPRLLDLGLRGMIGKGKRSQEVVDAIERNCAVYFGAIGGAGALLSECIKKSEIVAFEDLGAEAIRRLEVENFPAVVIIDSNGDSLYETGPKSYLSSRDQQNT